MSNFTCPTCGLTNIDCGKAGYKTAREIELEKQLEIAVKALKYYANEDSWYDGVSSKFYAKIERSMFNSYGFSLAQQALKEIEG